MRSPNTQIKPVTASINSRGHLEIGGEDTVALADKYGTPLWIMDEQTIKQSAQAVQSGLESYPDSRVLYAGKAFICLAMCHLVRSLGLGLDVVSEGELYTAIQADFPAELIYMHGNNKTRLEIERGLDYGNVNIVVDGASELQMVAQVSKEMGRTAKILFRVTPGVEPDTHHYIRTGQSDSKFGISLDCLDEMVQESMSLGDSVQLIGLHAHIGSQSKEIDPFLEIVEIFADVFLEIKEKHGYDLSELDLGGGLAIAYTEEDKPTPLHVWSNALSQAVKMAFSSRNLSLPRLLLEPGRSLVGTAGVTLYRAGHRKVLPGGLVYLAVDGGMADNPRPVTYQAAYTAAVASAVSHDNPEAITIVGKYCESGDIIVRDIKLAATTGDLVVVYGTGAYNYSMASNYNRTCRPACVLVADGKAEIIVERESNYDLIRQDRVPKRLSR